MLLQISKQNIQPTPRITAGTVLHLTVDGTSADIKE
jgi:hypothetical protein